MTYRYSVLYFLNLSLNIFFHRKRQFLWKYPNPETVIVLCFNLSRMPNQRTSQSKIEDIVHWSAILCLIKGRHIHPVRHAKHPKQILQTKHKFTTKLRGRPFDFAGEGGGLAVYVKSGFLRVTIFIFIQLQNRLFILRYSLFESDGCRIIYFIS